MKYFISDTEEHTLGEINNYFFSELSKTNLVIDDIKVEKSLRIKIGMMELDRIFDENGMAELIQIDIMCMHMNQTGNTICFSKGEVMSRYIDVLERMLNQLKSEL